MPILEMLIFVIIVISLVILFTVEKKRIWGFASIKIVFLLALLHIAINGFRWQMVPTYNLTFVLFTILLCRYIKSSKPMKKIWIVLFGLWLAGTILPSLMFPIFQLPPPGGPYRIGTHYLSTTDSSRSEVFAENSFNKREIFAQVWYPSNPGEDMVPEKYISDAGKMSRIIARSLGFSFLPFILSHLGLTDTHSYLDAPVSTKEQSFPVIIFSHGYRQFYKFNTVLMEALASHGYFVFAISHTYDTPMVIHPEKGIVEFKKKRIVTNQEIPHPEHQETGRLFERISGTKNLDKHRNLYGQFYQYPPESWLKSNDIWTKDIIFFIRQLDFLNQDRFEHQMDLNRIGVSGFSAGGSVAGLAAMQDNRIKAGVNIDGWQPGHRLKKYLSCPFMFITSENHRGANDFFLKYSRSLVYEATIAGTGHANFNDMALITGRLSKLTGRMGKIDGKYGLQLTIKCVLTFFNQHLKGDSSVQFLDLSKMYPELTINGPGL